jgi:hypothetical protein
MIDPVTFVLALLLVLSAWGYVKAKRRRAMFREFDGGWADENERRVTRILPPCVMTVKGDNE